ncbi:MAG: MFS transporter [Actinomycetota bacterium]
MPKARRSTSLGADFDRFWLAAAISNLGDGVRMGALPLLALALTDDARLIGLVSAATLLPWLVLGPVGGALVDRLDRRRVMVGAQLGRAVVVLVLTIGIAADTATIWWLVVVGFALGAGEILVDTSSQAAIPQLVRSDQLDRANGRIVTALTLMDEVIGVALGSVLFAVFVELPFIVDLSTFVIGATLLLTIRRPLQGVRAEGVDRPSIGADIAAGGRFLFHHRFLRGIMFAVATSNFASNTAFGVFVVLVVNELGAAEATFGLVLGVGAIGGVLGSLVAGRIAERFGRRAVLATLPLVLAATHAVNAVATAPWMVTATFFVSAFGVVCFNVPGQSLRQAVTPEPLLGRVVATFRMVGMGAAPLGAVLGGFITQAAGVRVTNWAAAGIELVGGILMIAALRHLDEALADADVTT